MADDHGTAEHAGTLVSRQNPSSKMMTMARVEPRLLGRGAGAHFVAERFEQRREIGDG